MTNLDRAYCAAYDCVLTIYQVRDLHFDDENEFHAGNAEYECPDEDCNAVLFGVNHTKVKFKNTPHFRIKKKHDHSDNCEFQGKESKRPNEDPEDVRNERKHKISDHPEVLLLERQPLPIGSGKPGKPRKETNPSPELDAEVKNQRSTKTPPHETSCLEHVVETWISNSKEDLAKSYLTIGNKTKLYRNAFQYLNHFQRESGLIYWGTVKTIKRWGKGYEIIFRQKPKVDGETRHTTIYLPSSLINSYRKKNLFRRHIENLINIKPDNVRCFFVGAYPKLKEEEIENDSGNYRPLEVKISNLDHLVLRYDEDED